MNVKSTGSSLGLRARRNYPGRCIAGPARLGKSLPHAGHGWYRDLVDRRLAELDEKRKHLAAELESLEHNALTEAEVAETVRKTARFAASLGSTLRQGPLAERQAAVRRCVERIAVDADDRRLRIDLHVLPGGLDGPAPASTETVSVTF